jgi:hypothetical protein
VGSVMLALAPPSSPTVGAAAASLSLSLSLTPTSSAAALPAPSSTSLPRTSGSTCSCACARDTRRVQSVISWHTSAEKIQCDVARRGNVCIYHPTGELCSRCHTRGVCARPSRTDAVCTTRAVLRGSSEHQACSRSAQSSVCASVKTNAPRVRNQPQMVACDSGLLA